MRVGVRGERKTRNIETKTRDIQRKTRNIERKSRNIHYKHLCIYNFIFSNTHHHNTLRSNEYSFEEESGRVNKKEGERREREEEITKRKKLCRKECGRR